MRILKSCIICTRILAILINEPNSALTLTLGGIIWWLWNKFDQLYNVLQFLYLLILHITMSVIHASFEQKSFHTNINKLCKHGGLYIKIRLISDTLLFASSSCIFSWKEVRAGFLWMVFASLNCLKFVLTRIVDYNATLYWNGQFQSWLPRGVYHQVSGTLVLFSVTTSRVWFKLLQV